MEPYRQDVETTSLMMGVTYIDAPSAALSEEAEKALQSIRDRPNWHPLLNRSVDVTQGPFKGYRGRVKSVNELDSSAQVEFEALLSKREEYISSACIASSITGTSDACRGSLGIFEAARRA